MLLLYKHGGLAIFEKRSYLLIIGVFSFSSINAVQGRIPDERRVTDRNATGNHRSPGHIQIKKRLLHHPTQVALYSFPNLLPLCLILCCQAHQTSS